MILELYMKNCALVEELKLEIGNNLNILTGETGSGKSIIIDALGLCLGEKYDRTFLRNGTEKGIVQAVFYSENKNLSKILNENGFDIDDDNTIIITREIYKDGKSIPRINGRVVKVSLLKEIASSLIDIHSQHQNQILYNKDNHLEILDLFGEKELEVFKKDYQKAYEEYNNLKSELKILNENKDDFEIEREIDLIKFQLNEIESSNLDKDEYNELLNKREIYRNSEKIFNNLNISYNLLYGGSTNIVDMIGNVSKELSYISNFDNKIEEFSSEVERIMYELQDISRDIRNYKENINFDEYEFQSVEARVDEINNLRRKYGDTIEDILIYYEKMNNRLEQILGKDERLEYLKNEIDKKEKVLLEKAKILTNERKKIALNLEKFIVDELISLDMKNSLFKVCFEDRNFNIDGKDSVEFMISFNLGEKIKPISKTASGGEMSRFMLSLKTILSNIYDIDTLVFDEIDTGISGIAAQIVGKKLSDMAQNKQIICITHLPQIAAYADTHYSIEKTTDKNRTFTSIKKLDEVKKRDEISRLIAGSNITEKTIEHAKEIIKLSKGSS